MDRMDFSQSPLELALRRELRRSERVLWQGEQIARISPKGFAMYFFAIPWTAFALFWTAMASVGASEMDDGAGLLAWAFPLFGLPFILIGLGMLSVPFLPLFQKGKVLYAVTNERVLKLTLRRRLDVKSVPARRIGPIERSERRDGSGSLKLTVNVRTDSDGGKQTEYFEIGEVADILSAHDRIAEIGRNAARQQGGDLSPSTSSRI